MTMIKDILGVFVLTAATITVVLAATTCPPTGCSVVHKPVCAGNGVTLMNECFAACQGIDVAHDGPCTTENSSFGTATAASAAGTAAGQLAGVATAAAVSAAVIAALAPQAAPAEVTTQRMVDAAAINKHRQSGLLLVGVMQPSAAFTARQPEVPLDYKSRRISNTGTDALDIAVTSDGLVYMPDPAKLAAAAADATNAAAAYRAAAAATSTGSNSRTQVPASGSQDGFDPRRRAERAAIGTALGGTAAAAAGAVAVPTTTLDVAATGIAVTDDAAEGDTATAAGGARRLLRLQAAAAATSSELGKSYRRLALSSSGASRRSLRAVFPEDNRQEVTGTPAYPYSAVGQITYQPDSSYGAYYTCSASLIGRFTVLTAAHCVVNRKSKQVPDTWSFAAGQTSAGSAAGSASGMLFYFNSKYLTAEDWWLWDMAVVVLDKPLGDTAGWLGFAWARNGFTGGLVVAGYPTDKAEGSLWVQAQLSCRVQWNGVGSYLAHKCDTVSGSSGSAMFTAVPAAASNTTGIVTDSSTGSSNGRGITRNAAGPRFYVRAVHNAGSASTNSAVPVNRFWAGFIQQYSGATPNLPVAPSAAG